MSELRQGEECEAALAAWERWHESIGAVPDPDDDYVPEMSLQWLTAFKAGAEWMQTKGEK